MLGDRLAEGVGALLRLGREGAAAARGPLLAAANPGAAGPRSPSQFFELDATAWSNNTVRVLARNASNTTIDLGAVTLSVQVTKRRVP